MTIEDHREPCKTLQNTVKELATAKTHEERTRSWVEAISNDLKKTNNNIVSLERSISEKLGAFNAALIARTSVISGGAAGGIVAIIEVVKSLLKI